MMTGSKFNVFARRFSIDHPSLTVSQGKISEESKETRETSLWNKQVLGELILMPQGACCIIGMPSPLLRDLK